MTMTVEDHFRQVHSVRKLRARAIGRITIIVKETEINDAERIQTVIDAYLERKEEIKQ